MALQVKVEFSGVHYLSINNSPSWAISAPVRVFAARREEPDMMAFPNDDDRDRRIYIQFLARR